MIGRDFNPCSTCTIRASARRADEMRLVHRSSALRAGEPMQEHCPEPEVTGNQRAPYGRSVSPLVHGIARTDGATSISVPLAQRLRRTGY